MNSKNLCLVFLSFLIFNLNFLNGQNLNSKLNNEKYIEKEPLYFVGAWLLVSNQIFQSNITSLSTSKINNLSVGKINAFDRGATKYFCPRRADISDALMYSSIAIPFSLIPKMVKNNNLKMSGIMFLEVGSITAGVTRITKSLTQRIRPFVYHPDAPLGEKLDHNAKRSFISGHTSISAAFSFYWATILSSYTESKLKKIGIWSLALALPITTGIFRYNSGNHFPTDIISGFIVGGAIGYFVPKYHLKTKRFPKKSISFQSSMNTIKLIYRLN